ncbi:MAG: 3-oxoacyl-[acyl-carrier-protein] reductase [Lachnospiraceae bacterium]|nr:3-oxoacyl-[acyl-carrier-protein] reductase [Lachnospiraceae bacterium]
MSDKKTAVITGAARGIGKAIAIAFAKEGYNIVINYHSNVPEATVAECEKLGAQVLSLQGDVSDFNFAKDFIQSAKKEFGTVDVLVNNAGITRDNLLLGMKEEEFDSVINTNLKGTFNMIKHASKVMLKQKSGSIVNIASVVGVTGNAGQANYAASKAGVIGLTKSAAKELASRGITVNAIAPGFIETDMTNVLTDEQKEKIFATIPMNKAGQPEDVAEAAVFLAKHGYITGQVVNVCGGLCI